MVVLENLSDMSRMIIIMVVKVILWTAPRCVSTSFERSIRTLSNSKVFHESFARPFYYGLDKQRYLFSSLPIVNDPTITCQNVKSLLCQDLDTKEMSWYFLKIRHITFKTSWKCSLRMTARISRTRF